MSGGYWYDMDRRGAAEVLKSAEVRAWVDEEAAKLCAQANRLQAARQDGHSSYRASPAKAGSFTTLASVYPADRAAQNDEAKHHTLESINH